MKYPTAQFTNKDVAEATEGLGATVLKPRRAPRPQSPKGTPEALVVLQ